MHKRWTFLASVVMACLLWSSASAWAFEASTLHTIHYGQGEVVYLDVASGGMPLVFVHGWSCDMSFWDAQAAELSKERRCILIDLPGHGASSAPEVDYTQEYLMNAVLAVMDDAGVEQAVLVGHSMGAFVIRILALEHPTRVAGLILVDGALMEAPEEPEARAALEEQLQAMRAMFTGEGAEQATREFIASMHSDQTSEEVRAWVMDKMLATPEFVRTSAMLHFLEPELWSRPPVKAPALALFAVSPDLPPNAEEMIRRMFPNLTWLLWDGPGHFLMQEKPEDVTMVIEDYLGKLGLR